MDPGRPLERENFRSGCVNPALVVGADLVAVYTDLSREGDRPFPCIKLVRQPLANMTGGDRPGLDSD